MKPFAEHHLASRSKHNQEATWTRYAQAGSETNRAAARSSTCYIVVGAAQIGEVVRVVVSQLNTMRSIPFVSGCVLMKERATLPEIDFVVSAHRIPSSIPVRWRLAQCT